MCVCVYVLCVRVGTARPASAIVLTEIAAAGAPALPMCALPNMPSYTCEGLMEVAKFAKVRHTRTHTHTRACSHASCLCA